MAGSDLPAPLFDALLRLVAGVGSYADARRATGAIVRGLVEEIGLAGAALWTLRDGELGESIACGAHPDEDLARAALGGVLCDARGCGWPLSAPGSPEVLGALVVTGELGEPARRLVGVLARRCAQILVDARRAEAQRLLLTGLSHELRAPLQSMLGYLDVLRAGGMGELAAPQREAVEAVARNAERVLAVARDVLQVARIDAGFERPIVGEVAIDELLLREVEHVRALAPGEGAAPEVECPSGLRVVTDGAKVARILTNLLTNALKYGGPAPVRVVAAESAGGGCTIEVVDSGPGIPREQHERVFDEFVRLGAGHDGVGLGLAISRRLAGVLGGRLELESEPGRGTRFRLSLPPAPPGPDLGDARPG